MTRARVVTETLGGSPLARAIQGGALPAGMQPWWPRSSAEWGAHVARVRASAATGWLETLRPAFAAGGRAAQRLGAAAERGLVVTTGQQAALFGGPLYTLAKAISALALADALQERHGVPVAPVFWAATDDADFTEAATVHVADANGVATLTLETTPPAGTPMADVVLGDTTSLLRRLHEACGSAAHEHYFEAARSAFVPTRTLGAAYVHLLRALLEPLGIAVLDPSHAAVRAAATPLLRRALDRAEAIHDAVASRSQAIRAAGYEPQVEDQRGLSLVFALERGVKRRIATAEADGYDRAVALSPNVLLRPVVERALLPTAAYVAGPGELAYFAQVSAVAESMESAAPVAVPRWSCTIVEPFTERALSRLGITVADVADVHRLEERFARAALPAGITDAWARLQQGVTASVEGLASANREAALVPDAVIEGLRRSLQHRIDRAERRLLAASKRRDDQVRRDLALVSAALQPMGRKQERTLNFIPMLARNGEDLIEAMRQEAARHAAALAGGAREPVTAT